jgi:hypothetical protein
MKLLEFLHDLPDLAVLPLIVALVVAGAMAAPFIGRRILRLRPNAARDEAAFDAYKAIMAMVGVVLAFSLVQVNANLRSAETIVGREASAFALVDRTLLRFGGPGAAQVRPLLAAYGQSRIHDEWPDLARAGRNAETEARYTALSRAGRAIEPGDPRQQAMYAELLKGLDDLAESRDLVLQDAETELPLFFWIVTDGFLALAFALALLADNTLGRAVGLGAAAAGVALLLAFVIIVDQPYRGETSVSPSPIMKALVLNSRRQ